MNFEPLNPLAKLKKSSRVSRACSNCRKRKQGCDEQRPCKRCVEKGIKCVEVQEYKLSRKKTGQFGTMGEMVYRSPTRMRDHRRTSSSNSPPSNPLSNSQPEELPFVPSHRRSASGSSSYSTFYSSSYSGGSDHMAMDGPPVPKFNIFRSADLTPHSYNSSDGPLNQIFGMTGSDHRTEDSDDDMEEVQSWESYSNRSQRSSLQDINSALDLPSVAILFPLLNAFTAVPQPLDNSQELFHNCNEYLLGQEFMATLQNNWNMFLAQLNFNEPLQRELSHVKDLWSEIGSALRSTDLGTANFKLRGLDNQSDHILRMHISSLFWSNDYGILYADSNFCKLVGAPLEDFAGRSALEIFHKEENDKIFHALLDLQSSRAITHIRTRLVNKEGGEVKTYCTLTNLRDPLGATVLTALYFYSDFSSFY